MNDPAILETQRDILLGGGPIVVVLLVALLGLAAWVLLHLYKPTTAPPLRRGLFFLLRIAVGFTAALGLLQVSQAVWVLATGWPVWPVALGCVVCIEISLKLYELERSLVPPPTRRTLGALRVALIVFVALMLLQPVRIFEWSQRIERVVAILIDDSTSMHIPDTRMSPSERIRLAEHLSVKAAHRDHRFEDSADALQPVQGTLASQGDWLTSLSEMEPDVREEQLETRRRSIHKTLKSAMKTTESELKAIKAPLEDGRTYAAELVKKISEVGGRFEKEVHKPLEQLVDKTAPERTPLKWLKILLERMKPQEREAAELAATTNAVPEDGETVEPISLAEHYESVRDSLHSVSSTLVELLEQIRDSGEQLDAAVYSALPDVDREHIDTLAHRDRQWIAEDLLLHRPLKAPDSDKTRDSFLETVTSDYHVQIYSFASAPSSRTETEVRDGYSNHTWSATYSTNETPEESAVTNLPASAAVDSAVATNDVTPAPREKWQAILKRDGERPLASQETDLATALEQVMVDLPGHRLGAIVVLSDGQHNASRSVEPVARQLSQQGVTINSIVLGSRTNAPPDAAIASLETPDMIYSGDKVYLNTEIKLDGITNKVVNVALYRGDELVDEREIEIKDSTGMRAAVELSHEPEESGLQTYRVVVDGFDHEVVATNNEQQISVNVSDDRVRLLLIDGRPSWEFRYIKNLFANRDRSTQLQYVLLQPDIIADAPEREPVYASVARERDEIEATHLPLDEEEWMKFDVIILGDVDPESLGAERLRILDRFVSRRGGALIIVSGPMHMPHRYTESALADLLPVTVRATESALMAGPEEFYRLALTSEGAQHEIMRLETDPELNREAWNSVPEITWRHTSRTIKPGSTVLAYAQPIPVPDFMRGEVTSEEQFRKRNEFERRNALVSMHQVGSGDVIYLGFNRTWRLRYRVGDRYHHKFWGQLLRWATSDKLPFGSDYARVGTDQARYLPEQIIRVRAKLVDKEYEPIVSKRVYAQIYSGEDLVARKKMEYVKDSAGLYEASLGLFTNGRYRVELHAPDVNSVFGKGALTNTVSYFAIEEGLDTERVEFFADRGLLTRLASMTRGLSVEPPDSEKVLERLGPSVIDQKEREQFDLWSSWPWVFLITLTAASEWVLRKRQRLP
ncbi:MAG: VWA domain-containing protein [Verrucomicrobia bacterium]|nr:VWA domain-containing protein [Verrucomicrobiota bacterium]